jgi:hypothetical protein
VGGLVVFDLGFFSFLWCDDFTGSQQFFVTRMREKTAYRTVQVLSGSPYDRDALLHVGQYRSNPCTYPRRMVSVLWQGAWDRYLTTVLDPQVLSTRQVGELYRRRWRIEDACALTKRLLDLAYVWTGSTHAVQWQLEMVFRAFSHDSRAVQRGECDDLVAFLVEHVRACLKIPSRKPRNTAMDHDVPPCHGPTLPL